MNVLQYKPFNECTQPPQEQPGVMSLRTQSTDIFTQLCSLPSMTMSQDVSNVLQWGEKGRECVLCVCVCVRGLKREAKGARCCAVHAYLCRSTANFPAVPATAPSPPLPPQTPTLYQHQTSWLRRSADDFITHPPTPYTLSLCHSILITLIKSFVHLEISDDNLFHSTLQQWWLWREEN